MVVGRNIIQTYGKNALFQRFFINSAIEQKYLKLGMVISLHYSKTFCCIATCLEEFDFWPLFHRVYKRLCDRSAVYVSKMCK